MDPFAQNHYIVQFKNSSKYLRSTYITWAIFMILIYVQEVKKMPLIDLVRTWTSIEESLKTIVSKSFQKRTKAWPEGKK